MNDAGAVPTEQGDSSEEGSGRRAFLMLAGAAAAGGVATTLVSASPASASSPPDVTVDQLPAAVALTGSEVLHGVQTVGSVAGDVAISASQLQQYTNGQSLVSSSDTVSGYTWVPGVTHIVASNAADYLPLQLPSYFASGWTRIPEITVVQSSTGRIAFAATGSNSLLESLPLTQSDGSLTRLRSKGTWAVARIVAVPYGGVTVWIVSGDVEGY